MKIKKFLFLAHVEEFRQNILKAETRCSDSFSSATSSTVRGYYE